MTIVNALVGTVTLGVVWLGVSVRVVKQFERGVVFWFGRVHTEPRGPGLALIVPIVDRLQKVNMQIITMPVPAQEGITRDNVTVRVDAVVYFRVVDPVRVTVDMQDYDFAVGQVAQTSLRSIIGKSDLDDLLTNRERLNQGLEVMIDSPALSWGVHIERVEIKDVALPESMKRSMSRQAEAERERRARVITADGELQASEKLAQAAAVMADAPAALQLRLLERRDSGVWSPSEDGSLPGRGEPAGTTGRDPGHCSRPGRRRRAGGWAVAYPGRAGAAAAAWAARQG